MIYLFFKKEFISHFFFFLYKSFITFNEIINETKQNYGTFFRRKTIYSKHSLLEIKTKKIRNFLVSSSFIIYFVVFLRNILAIKLNVNEKKIMNKFEINRMKVQFLSYSFS